MRAAPPAARQPRWPQVWRWRRWGRTASASIRIPASYCGIYGLKPTHGEISPWLGAGRAPAGLGGPAGAQRRGSHRPAAGAGRLRCRRMRARAVAAWRSRCRIGIRAICARACCRTWRPSACSRR
ncbi:amidase family protein [Rhodanobacter lindaniclasticus]